MAELDVRQVDHLMSEAVALLDRVQVLLRSARAKHEQKAAETSDLHVYGYAPGSYMSHCLTCDQTMRGVDKYCRVCMACAIKRRDAAKKLVSNCRIANGMKPHPVEPIWYACVWSRSEPKVEWVGNIFSTLLECHADRDRCLAHPTHPPTYLRTVRILRTHDRGDVEIGAVKAP